MYGKLWVSILAGLYPAVFFVSNNWHVFSFPQLVVLILGSVVLASTGLLLLSAVVDLLLKGIVEKIMKKNLEAGRQSINNVVMATASLSLCVYLLRNTLFALEVHPTVVGGVLFSVFLSFSWLAYHKGLRPLINALLIVTVISISNMVLDYYHETKVPIEDWLVQHKDVYDQVTFRRSPNVYLIITESYPNRAALKAVYGIDNSSFYRKLAALGLEINHHHFSNYNHTLASLPSLFGMEHHYGQINIGNFDSLGGRRMLEGRIYNPVIDIFRNNGYKIQYLHNVIGLMPNGADVDVCVPSPSPFYGLEMFVTHQNIKKRSIFSSYRLESIQPIRESIADSIAREEQYFTFIYVDFPDHSPSRLKSRSRMVINRKLADFRNGYDEEIEAANEKLAGLVDDIITRDRDSIIILLGDHGSWGYRLKEDARGRDISNQLYILDRFGVLAAMRAPAELAGIMKNGAVKTHVNIFKHVFAYLSEDDRILRTRAPDDSYEGPFILAIRDGHILPNFIKLSGRTSSAERE